MKKSQLQQLIKECIKEIIQKVGANGVFHTDPDTPDEVTDMVHNLVVQARTQGRNPQGIVIVSPSLSNSAIGYGPSHPGYEQLGDIWMIISGSSPHNYAFMAYGTKAQESRATPWVLSVSEDTKNWIYLKNNYDINKAIMKMVKSLPKL